MGRKSVVVLRNWSGKVQCSVMARASKPSCLALLTEKGEARKTPYFKRKDVLPRPLMNKGRVCGKITRAKHWGLTKTIPSTIKGVVVDGMASLAAGTGRGRESWEGLMVTG